MLLHIKRFIKIILGQETKEYSTEEIEDIKNVRLKPKHIYIEKREGKERWLHLMCPSGCGELLSVNLMRSVMPYWTVIRNKDHTVTLSPSINKIDGCKSHFFIRESQIIWV